VGTVIQSVTVTLNHGIDLQEIRKAVGKEYTSKCREILNQNKMFESGQESGV
jgi:hypothetical protein